jgi:hypothetical protein
MLAVTGAHPIWIILGSFAMVAVGCAVMRIVPRRLKR